MYKFGSVISWAVPPEQLKGFNKFFDKCQNFFTGQKETHSSIMLHQVIRVDDEKGIIAENSYYEIEASNTVRCNMYAPNDNATIFRINAPYEVLRSVIEKLKEQHIGKPYAIMQVLYFVFRWFMELFDVDVRKWWNPLGLFFLICSELVYLYLYRVAQIMKWNEVIEFMEQWNPDTAHSGDIRIILNFMNEKGYATKE